MAHIRQRLAEDGRTAELAVQVVYEDGVIWLEGAVTGEGRVEHLLAVAREAVPDCEIRSRVQVTELGAPGPEEVL
ncbi:phospholipid-binding protein [Allonocardiopsis opalescens]|uniref:BON domain-containing protein n=1 Tax=Allonocardiopsis opalescens TaxID=1144618 RepID=A0A2T0PXI2_9ACTN|nr:phospholipid-binding protein [Allonocardiopsis opalescens]PRX96148.1 hypothetical protein CLV72_108154 [Allonocardiopsis opalescens]